MLINTEHLFLKKSKAELKVTFSSAIDFIKRSDLRKV